MVFFTSVPCWGSDNQSTQLASARNPRRCRTLTHHPTRCTTTAIILSPRRRKGPAPASPQPAQPPAGSETAAVIAAQPDASWLDSLALVDTWQLGSDVGRRYGLLNGDLNPIHLHAVTARLFGFRRPIAHALFLTGRAEAALRNAGGLGSRQGWGLRDRGPEKRGVWGGGSGGWGRVASGATVCLAVLGHVAATGPR